MKRLSPLLFPMMLFQAFLLGCTSLPATEQRSVTKLSCEEQGGTLVNSKAGEVCSMPATDSHRQCTDSRQCQGLCLSNGYCSDRQQYFGCHDVLHDGQPATLCID